MTETADAYFTIEQDGGLPRVEGTVGSQAAVAV